MNLYQFFRPLIFRLEPECAHNLAIQFIKNNPLILNEKREYTNLKQKIWDINFANPIGMAAGFDKNAVIAKQLAKFGFGFVECGTVTPKAQSGNDKPRIFRLKEDDAIINRLGFNNLGADNFLQNIEKIGNFPCPIGINIGKNKDTDDALSDYLILLKKFYSLASYITINISSPNTKNLRDLQSAQNLDTFLSEIIKEKNRLKKQTKNIPILLKIAPDLTKKQQEDIAQIALERKIDGLIINNTTISRPKNLLSKYQIESGGLSGKPLFKASNEVLKNIYSLTQGKIPIIGVGGISNADEALEKIKNGASLLQIYSAFIYEGFGLVERIKRELSKKIAQEGVKNISQIVGINAK